MVLMIEPVFMAIEKLRGEREYDEIIYTSPDGCMFTQKTANILSLKNNIIILAGHYKGIDQRIRDNLITMEISIGDYVLSGGEAAAMVLIDAVVRLLPGALGDEESCNDESFSHGLLEYPQYTRPRVFREMDVPDILLSGDHARIEQWRREQAVERTARRRPDLLDKWKQDKVDDSSMKE